MKFIFSMLTGESGRISSKRGVMMILLTAFLVVVFTNLYTGKQLAQTYSEQLFEVLCLSLVLVFGEKILPYIATLRGKKTPPAGESEK
jgi:hypothetical protein